jgi:hypothetical protein
VIQPTCGPLAPRAILLSAEPFFLEETRKSYWGNLVLYSSPQSFNDSDDLIITSKGHYLFFYTLYTQKLLEAIPGKMWDQAVPATQTP